jgi:hypothetical protein
MVAQEMAAAKKRDSGKFPQWEIDEQDAQRDKAATKVNKSNLTSMNRMNRMEEPRLGWAHPVHPVYRCQEIVAPCAETHG